MHTSTTRWARGLACLGLCSACGGRAGLDVVPEVSQRWLATPSGIAVLSQSRSVAGLPGEITFGDPSGRSALYLQFSPEWRDRGVPLKGFLTLEPRAGAAPESEPVHLEVWHVRAPWRPDALRTWADKPELAPPFVSIDTSSSPAHTLRIDITEILRFLARNPDFDQGIALIARSGDGHGISFATGISGGAAPRLEMYTR